MSYVVVNSLTVPEGAGPELERRFAGRAGAVEGSPGFERFELLRPDEGTAGYLVYTRWASRAHYEAWRNSADFGRGHQGPPAAAGAEGAAPPPVALGSEIWAYEVAASAEAPPAGVERP